jgi:hypothetical protein
VREEWLVEEGGSNGGGIIEDVKSLSGIGHREWGRPRVDAGFVYKSNFHFLTALLQTWIPQSTDDNCNIVKAKDGLDSIQ